MKTWLSVSVILSLGLVVCSESSSILCSTSAPCYNVVLHVAVDGTLEFDPDDGGFEKHFALAGLGRQEIANLSRKAHKYFEDEYGMIFDHTEAELVKGNFMKKSRDGKASILAYRAPLYNRLRVYTATVGDQIQLMNAPTGVGGWIVQFTEDYVSTGKTKITIPKTAYIYYGYYIILPCENQPRGHCRNILNPDDPAAPIMVLYRANKYIHYNLNDFLFFEQQDNYSILDAHVHSDLFGDGHARGIFPLRDAKRNLAEGWIDLVFSSYPYPYTG